MDYVRHAKHACKCWVVEMRRVKILCIFYNASYGCEARSGGDARHAGSRDRINGSWRFPGSCVVAHRKVYYVSDAPIHIISMKQNGCLANSSARRLLERFEAFAVARGLASRLRLKHGWRASQNRRYGVARGLASRLRLKQRKVTCFLSLSFVARGLASRLRLKRRA